MRTRPTRLSYSTTSSRSPEPGSERSTRCKLRTGSWASLRNLATWACRYDAGEPPACIGRALVAAIRQVADADDYVGKGVMLNCLPRIAVLRGMFEKQLILIAGEPDSEVGTFLYIPHNASAPATFLDRMRPSPTARR